jgi:DNA-binding response OmpR family regulator
MAVSVSGRISDGIHEASSHGLRDGLGVGTWTKNSLEVETSSRRMTRAVLLIDDNAVQAATRQTILRRAGYFVIAALNPRRALDQLNNREFPAEIGLIITDHMMPEMSGSEFVEELRRSHVELPVLVISGLEEAEAEYAGMNVLFRVKPLLPDNLLASVHRLLQPGPSEA